MFQQHIFCWRQWRAIACSFIIYPAHNIWGLDSWRWSNIFVCIAAHGKSIKANVPQCPSERGRVVYMVRGAQAACVPIGGE